MMQKAVQHTQNIPTKQTKVYLEDGIGFVELVDTFGSDLTVANAARVSFNKESAYEPIIETKDGVETIVGHTLPERDKKLINFLAEHQHITPFFHPQIQLRIKMPIFVAREWFRSVIGFARNEVSRRYVSYAAECFVPSILRKKDINVKQGSSAEPVDNNEAQVAKMKAFVESTIAYYEQLMAEGVCPEQARMILPQSMYTEFIETASVSAYARIVLLRSHPTAQREIQDFARAVDTLAREQFPVSWSALCKAL